MATVTPTVDETEVILTPDERRRMRRVEDFISNEPEVLEERDSGIPYPVPIGSDARIGITGRLVAQLEPHTEADPSFLLVSFLTTAGNVFGRRAYVVAGGDRHYSNLFVCGVGPTATGRKGSAAAPIDRFFEGIDDQWVRCIQSGLSSGEGLIWCVRDPVQKREVIKGKKGEPDTYAEVCEDEGVSDKRLLVRQSEFFGALQVMKRQGNTLSSTIRDAWDRGNLNTMVKNSPARATEAHISIIANISREELLRAMLSDEMDNGFANRFLWVLSSRSKCLPEGGRLLDALRTEEFAELRRDFNRAQGRIVCGPMYRDGDASDLWGYDDNPDTGVYRHLTRERHGMFGKCTARAAPNVLRISLIYALLDGATEIRREHLTAALEVWRYCEESARFIFGDALGDSTADFILQKLRTAPGGITRTEINTLFQKHKASSEISRALDVLKRARRARCEPEPTGGRPTERWFATSEDQS